MGGALPNAGASFACSYPGFHNRRERGTTRQSLHWMYGNPLSLEAVIMQKLKFRDFIDIYAQHEELVGEVPQEVRLNAKAAEVKTWFEFERRLRAGGAEDELCQAGKRIWQRYRVATRSTLA